MAVDKLAKTMTEYPNLPLRDVVFQTLRKGILRGDLKAGERLMEIKLANRLGVSRTPIREAIRMLELEGLVVNLPRRGAQVSSITEEDLRDVLEVREGLEDLAVKLACERMTEEDLSELYAASRKFEKLTNKSDITALAEADEHFHEIIFRSTGNRRLCQLLNNLREQMYRYRIEYLKDEKNRRSLIGEHDKLWEALGKKDLKTARRVMKTHIERQALSIENEIEDKKRM